MTQKLIFFTLPRTGSTLISRAYALYRFHKDPNDRFLGEYFNLRSQKFWPFDTAKTIGNLQVTDGIQDRHFTKEFMKLEHERRLNLLKKYPNQQFIIKLMSQSTPEYCFDYLVNETNYEFVLLERKDLLDHMLSWYIAMDNDIWNLWAFDHESYKYTENYREIYDKKYHFDYPVFEYMKERIEYYYSKRRKLKWSRIHSTIFYEDFSHYNNLEVLTALGIDDFSEVKVSDEKLASFLPMKLSTKEQKIDMFDNIDEVKEWIRTIDVPDYIWKP